VSGVVVNADGSVSRANRVLNIDDYGADPTGTTASNQALIDARAALGDSPGVIEFGVGTYKLTAGLNSESGRSLGLNQGVRGQGAGLTTVEYDGTYEYVCIAPNSWRRFAIDTWV